MRYHGIDQYICALGWTSSPTPSPRHTGDLFLEAVSKHRPYLKSIDLSNRKEFTLITEYGLAALAAGCRLMFPSSYRFSSHYTVAVDRWFEALIKNQPDTTAMKFTTLAYRNGFVWRFSPATLAKLVRGCPRIPIESFVHGGDDSFCAAIAQRVESSRLTKIDLTQHDAVTGKGLVHLIKACNNLHPDDILVKDAKVKDDEFFRAVAKHRPNLTKIDLTDSGITEEGLVALLIGCSGFKPISHPSGGDAYCAALLENRPNLERIQIEDCEKVTTEGVIRLINGFDLPLDQIEAATINKNHEFCAAVVEKYPQLKQISFKADKSVTITEDTPEAKRARVSDLEQSLREKGFQVIHHLTQNHDSTCLTSAPITRLTLAHTRKPLTSSTNTHTHTHTHTPI